MLRVGRLALCIAGLFLIAGGARALRLSAFDGHQQARRYEDVYYVPAPEALPVLSLGYRQALADLLWCRSLVYYGEELGQRGPVKHAFDYTDAILALDPDFRSAYRWIATAALYRPAAVDIEEGLRAAEYLARAVQRWPEDGELRWDYGSLLRFELAPLLSAGPRKTALLERAAPELEAAARLGAGPPWLGLVNANLLTQLGRTEQAIRHLEVLAETLRDPEVLREIRMRLAALYAQRERALDEARKAPSAQTAR